VVLDAIAQGGGPVSSGRQRRREDDDRELEALAAGGLDGCRFTFLPRLGARPDMAAFESIVARIAPLRWHVDLYLPAAHLEALAPRLEALPSVRHRSHGVVDASAGLEQPAFQTLLSLLGRDEQCW